MDVKYVNPFISSFQSVMPQLGFNTVQVGGLSAKSREVITSGALVVVGVVGDIKGNVVYTVDTEVAKQIASTMMMGMPVEEFDDMAKSALSELTNMLTASAVTMLADTGVKIDISTPTLLHGQDVCMKIGSDQILCVRMIADGNPMEVNIAFNN